MRIEDAKVGMEIQTEFGPGVILAIDGDAVFVHTDVSMAWHKLTRAITPDTILDATLDAFAKRST